MCVFVCPYILFVPPVGRGQTSLTHRMGEGLHKGGQEKQISYRDEGGGGQTFAGKEDDVSQALRRNLNF